MIEWDKYPELDESVYFEDLIIERRNKQNE